MLHLGVPPEGRCVAPCLHLCHPQLDKRPRLPAGLPGHRRCSQGAEFPWWSASSRCFSRRAVWLRAPPGQPSIRPHPSPSSTPGCKAGRRPHGVTPRRPFRSGRRLPRPRLLPWRRPACPRSQRGAESVSAHGRLWGPAATRGGAPAVTRVSSGAAVAFGASPWRAGKGAALRRCSVDLAFVLPRGEMSCVGPRQISAARCPARGTKSKRQAGSVAARLPLLREEALEEGWGERLGTGVPSRKKGATGYAPKQRHQVKPSRGSPCREAVPGTQGNPFSHCLFTVEEGVVGGRQAGRMHQEVTCDGGASRGPALLRCSSPCCASRTKMLSVLQLFTASSFCKRCTHRIFFFPSLPPSLSFSFPSLQRCSHSASHSAPAACSPTCTHAAHAAPRAGCPVGPLHAHPLLLLPWLQAWRWGTKSSTGLGAAGE